MRAVKPQIVLRTLRRNWQRRQTIANRALRPPLEGGK
jgi:hypothetical protein